MSMNINFASHIIHWLWLAFNLVRVLDLNGVKPDLVDFSPKLGSKNFD